jgi:hypothetical protein
MKISIMPLIPYRFVKIKKKQQKLRNFIENLVIVIFVILNVIIKSEKSPLPNLLNFKCLRTYYGYYQASALL